jgi:hypothetical protein
MLRCRQAQGADIDPGAGIELEILGDAAIEEQVRVPADRIGKVTASPIR